MHRLSLHGCSALEQRQSRTRDPVGYPRVRIEQATHSTRFVLVVPLIGHSLAADTHRLVVILIILISGP